MTRAAEPGTWAAVDGSPHANCGTPAPPARRAGRVSACAQHHRATAARRFARLRRRGRHGVRPGRADDRVRAACGHLQAARTCSPAIRSGRWNCSAATSPSRWSLPARHIRATRRPSASLKRLFGMKGAEIIGKRVVFLDDYDLATAAWLVRGCDVWLNVPRPPLEASGTSGMKSVDQRRSAAQRARRLVGRGLRRQQRLGDPRRGRRRSPGPGRPRCRRASSAARRGGVPAFYDRDDKDCRRRGSPESGPR